MKMSEYLSMLQSRNKRGNLCLAHCAHVLRHVKRRFGVGGGGYRWQTLTDFSASINQQE